MNKIRYPARFFHLLKKYPVKRCLTCGKQLTPKLYSGGKNIEALKAFGARQTCGNTCSGVLRRSRKVKAAKPAAPKRASGTCNVHGDYLHGPNGCPSCAVAMKTTKHKGIQRGMRA